MIMIFRNFLFKGRLCANFSLNLAFLVFHFIKSLFSAPSFLSDLIQISEETHSYFESAEPCEPRILSVAPTATWASQRRPMGPSPQAAAAARARLSPRTTIFPGGAPALTAAGSCQGCHCQISFFPMPDSNNSNSAYHASRPSSSSVSGGGRLSYASAPMAITLGRPSLALLSSDRPKRPRDVGDDSSSFDSRRSRTEPPPGQQLHRPTLGRPSQKINVYDPEYQLPLDGRAAPPAPPSSNVSAGGAAGASTQRLVQLEGELAASRKEIEQLRRDVTSLAR